ncbi:MAG: hypothetical protein ACWGMZ_04720, partial [Thermoguttaceae bacterium]
ISFIAKPMHDNISAKPTDTSTSNTNFVLIRKSPSNGIFMKSPTASPPHFRLFLATHLPVLRHSN